MLASVSVRVAGCSLHRFPFENISTWHLEAHLRYPSIRDPPTPTVPCPPLVEASIQLWVLAVSTIHVFLGSVMFPSGRHPPIFLLVFNWSCVMKFPIKNLLWIIPSSYNTTCPFCSSNFNGVCYT